MSAHSCRGHRPAHCPRSRPDTVITTPRATATGRSTGTARQADCDEALHGTPLQFGFGTIRHERLRPVRHVFGYPGCFLRVRIDGTAAPQAARDLWPWFGWERAAPMSFRSSDHGDGVTPPEIWIRALCAQSGLAVDGPIWLQTFPRMLGYAFKPVSFWFCHRADGELIAVVAEVNNTFGERHCYLLAEPDGAPLRAGRDMRASKVFHVSPFFDVQGEYVFRFLHRDGRAVSRIELHDEQGLVLVTSLSGRLEPASAAVARRALFGHPLFTLGVIARIHLQAWRLWRAGVPFHRKPSPPEDFVTRSLP